MTRHLLRPHIDDVVHTIMAAIGRLARLAVNLSSRSGQIIARCPKHSGVLKQCRNRTSSNVSVAIPRSLSRPCSSYAVRRDDRRGDGWGPLEGGGGLDEAVFRMEGQMRRYARADPDAFQDCFDLLKSSDQVTPSQALAMIRAVGRICKWPANRRYANLQTLWEEITKKGVSLDISHYNAALKVKIESEVEFQPTDFLADLQNKGFSPNKVTYQLLIDYFCSRGDVEGAQLVLEAIKERDLPVSKIMFDSLIKGHMKKGDKEGAQGMLDAMREGGLEPNGDTYKVLMCGYAEQGNMDTVKQTLEEARTEYVMPGECQLFSVVYSLAHSGHGQHVDEILEIIQNESEQYNNEGRNSMFKLMNSGHTDTAYQVFKILTLADGQRLKCKVFLRALVDTGVPFEEVKPYILRMEQDGALTESVDSITSWMEVLSRRGGGGGGARSQNSEIKSMAELQSMSVEELEAEKTSLLAANTTTTRIDLILLSKYCASRDTEKADELKASMDARGFKYQAPLLRQLATLSVIKQDLSQALLYKEEMSREYPEFTDYTALVLQIARLQIQEGKHQDAMSTLREYSSLPGIQGDIPLKELSGLYRGLVATCAESSPPEVTRELVDTLHEGGYVKSDDGALLGFIVKAHMDRGDMDGALTALEHCLATYGRGAKQRQLMRKLVESEDTERLQKVVDMLSKYQNEVEVLTRLAFRFIECDKLKQARKLFQTLRQRINMSVVAQECDLWCENKMPAPMEKFVEFSKDMYGFERDRILFHLIKVHVNSKNPQKALDALHYYEEEGLTPTPKTLRYLANFLKRENHPVPFDVPDDIPNTAPAYKQQTAMSGENRKPPQPSTTPAATPKKAPKVYSLEELAEELIRTQEQGERVESRLIPSVRDLAVEDLDTLSEKVLGKDKEDSSESKVRLILTSYRFRAYVNSGRVSEVFEDTLQDPRLLELSLTSGNIALLLELHPEMGPQVEEAILRQSGGENPLALNSLINSYLLKGKITEVCTILEKRPELKETKSLVRVSQYAESRKNEQLLQDMIEEFKDWPNSQMKVVFVNAIKMKCRERDYQGALSYLTTAQERGISVQDLSIVLSKHLQPLLVANEQPLPWQDGELGEVPQQENVSEREHQQSVQK